MELHLFSLSSTRIYSLTNRTLRPFPRHDTFLLRTKFLSSFCTPRHTHIISFSNKVQATFNGSEQVGSEDWLQKWDPHRILGVTDNSDVEEIKSAFRTKIKEFHPDVYQGDLDSHAISQRLVEAYEFLLNESDVQEKIRKSSEDPFEEPEASAEQVFVNEMNCIGPDCPYSCVTRAPSTFEFTTETNRARAVNQGQDDAYSIHLAVGQCPRNCIHYVTPKQKVVLDDLLRSAIEGSDSMEQVSAMLYGLIARATFENGRERMKKRTPKSSDRWVDWF